MGPRRGSARPPFDMNRSIVEGGAEGEKRVRGREEKRPSLPSSDLGGFCRVSGRVFLPIGGFFAFVLT